MSKDFKPGTYKTKNGDTAHLLHWCDGEKISMWVGYIETSEGYQSPREWDRHGKAWRGISEREPESDLIPPEPRYLWVLVNDKTQTYYPKVFLRREGAESARWRALDSSLWRVVRVTPEESDDE